MLTTVPPVLGPLEGDRLSNVKVGAMTSNAFEVPEVSDPLVATSVQLVPAALICSVWKVASPLVAATVSVPESVPPQVPPGSPLAIVMLPV